ncbi:MAG: ABC transporter ATP-binding protein [Pseudobutyrivibrio sp.]|uniref:ABC transporter ATP-binding protein n=2 Tax=Pseudobutyrivibrio TaxID=46205 RepID=A0A2G3EC63_9FIRM|nr:MULTISPECIES: ABC transporter ATP-binding protein [Pseudobutyrivibrio]NEX01851.1 ABC transporter ATP-binding protein [Pseudobutyrivibrio xylanivorans]MBE5905078.1 ABC transporter ATP-binding protein [Pseudobutyrivibrio sp.]PHU36278.1 ABC transporter ATP-binding protein [Pseudobutyrivibrio ruminis]PHU40918.1 ABC transporter ATP-binding protein [Pseudobutyrivibrio ruminis]SCY23455.1 ABC-2 type transport system ATP-binding protein [Pseudobutyrivibrio sp. AR14]
MIQVNNVTKKFGDFTALDGLDMHVERGAIYGLVGPNGAGKSTIIRHLCGVYKQDAGDILIEGQPVFENELLKQKMAIIPDDIFFFLQANTKDMMKFYKNMYPKFDEKLFFKIAECFPEINMKKMVRSLSKGMQKQVAFMLAIASRPEVMILDEPVDGLDPVMRRQVWSLIMSDVAETGVTVLVSSHNLRELEDVCDHVGIMNHGKLLIERSLDELQTSITKIQIAFEGEMPEMPEEIQVLKKISNGRVHTLIVKGEPRAAEQRIAALNPLLMDVLPLTLEEIFIYELGGEDYAVKDIIF